MPKNYKAITLFLVAITALLVIFIFFKGISVYQTSKSGTEQQLQPSISCTSYIYSIDGISYDHNTKALTFLFENKQYSDAEVHNITVQPDKGSGKTSQQRLIQGMKKKIAFSGLDIEKNFKVYPDGCSLYAKTCILETKECTGYQV